MSNNISDKQLRMSLAGQIALKLDAKDGNTDGQISQSVWNTYWEENNGEEFKGKKENVGQNGISVQEAFKLIMTRIFNAAKKQLDNSQEKSWNNQADRENAVNTIAKEWLTKVDTEKQKPEDVKVNNSKSEVIQSKQQTASQTHIASNAGIFTQEKFQQTKNLVIQNISRLELPEDMDKSKLQASLLRAQEKPIELPDRELSKGDIANALILALLKEAYPEKDLHELKRLSISNAAKLLPNDTIAKVKVSELNAQFIGDLASIDEVSPPVDFRANVEKAVQLLNTELKTLSESDLKTLGISPEKRDRLLNYINNLTYDSTHSSGQGKGLWIVMSTNWTESHDISSMVAILMHEANHCDENYLSQHPEKSEKDNYRFRSSSGDPQNNRICNTKEEERACETLGMLTAGLLAKKGVIPDYKRYPQDVADQYKHSVKDYIDSNGNPTQLLKDDINTWVEGYTNYPEDLNGNLNIRHMKEQEGVILSQEERGTSLQIQEGDIIKIGDKTYTIGAGNCILSPIDSAPIFQLVSKNGLHASNIVFDSVKPNQTELDLVASRTKKESDRTLTQQHYIEIVVIKRNGEEIKGRIYE